MKIVGRLGALILGVLGFVLGFIFNIAHSTLQHVFDPGYKTHGFIALLFLIVGLIGALMALPKPTAAAVLLVIAAIGFIVFVGFLAGIVPVILFLLAALLAYVDRSVSARAV